jgi:putative protease
MNIIYNSVPLSLHSDAVKLTKGLTPRLDFTVENERETKAVISFFETVFSNGAGAVLPYNDYTTGHEKRGVE